MGESCDERLRMAAEASDYVPVIGWQFETVGEVADMYGEGDAKQQVDEAIKKKSPKFPIR